MRTILLPVFVVFTSLLCAQLGTLDPTFGAGDRGYASGDGASGTVSAIVVQADGRIILGGQILHYNDTNTGQLTRIQADGSVDRSFGIAPTYQDVRSVVLQSDGKVLVGGFFALRIARLLADGAADTGFDVGTGADGIVNSVLVQTNGKIIIAGGFTSYNGTPRNRVARLNADGSVDASFNPGSAADGTVITAALQADGKLIIAGNFTSYAGVARNRIARLHSDGSLDLSFDPASGPNDHVSQLLVQPDGKVLLAGTFTTFDGAPAAQLTRLHSNGVRDGSFSTGSGFGGPGGATAAVRALALLPNGKLMVGGYFNSYNGSVAEGLARLNTNGTFDTGFTTEPGVNGSLSAMHVFADGRILLGGGFSGYGGRPCRGIVRIQANGALDPSFNPSGGANAQVGNVVRQPDGKVLIVGAFSGYANAMAHRMARLLPNGEVDASFNAGTGPNGEVHSCIRMPDGKWTIVGAFTEYNGVPRRQIARLHADGSLDLSFDAGTAGGGATAVHIARVAALENGKLIVAGNFRNFADAPHQFMVRLHADGALDTDFRTMAGFNNPVSAMAVQPDGKIFIGGAFTPSGSVVIPTRLARLNADGSLDPTFNTGTGANGIVQHAILQADGRILIAGAFNSINGTARQRIARLNGDGSLDTDFDPGAGPEQGEVRTMVQQPDGMVLIGGTFTAYAGVARARIARLNTDGSLDMDFDPGEGARGAVQAIALQPDGKLLIGGAFTSYDGIGRNRIARLHGGEGVGIGGVGGAVGTLALFPNPTSGPTTLRGDQSGSMELRIQAIDGRILLRERRVVLAGQDVLADLSQLAAGVYIVGLYATDGSAYTARVVKQ